MRNVERKLDAMAAMLTHEMNQLYAERDNIDARINVLAERRAVVEAAVPMVKYCQDSVDLHTGRQ